MDLSYSGEHESFRREVQNFLAENARAIPKHFGVNRPTAEAVAWQRLLIERGYVARGVPRRYGGAECPPDIMRAQILGEEFARARAPLGLVNQGISMFVPTLLEWGTEAQKQDWIARTIRGELIWCQGYSEPGAGSDLASLRTFAVEDGNDFIINGQKIWTTTAHAADMMFALVRTELEAKNRYRGITYICLSMQTPGIEVRPLRTMTGAAEFNEVFLTDVRVPKHQVIGARGDGWRVSNSTLKHERGMLGDPHAALARIRNLLGLMADETVDGVSAIELPVWRDRAMRLQGRALAMKYHAMRLLTAAHKGEDLVLPRLIVKLQATELNHQIAALAVDVMGEMGLLYNDAAHSRAGGLWQKRLMFDLGMIIGGGTAQIQRNIIAERGLGLPREPKMAKL
ncbi:MULTISPECIES: acyl-CoA dehydrogenase family protein [unclassified Chelatococcus]|uniref:acyl-CoA dehydrogenase family protein n=1 Tax=unclassified Chelatococcus TaxID=2638111 RepID=UPI001BCA7013|nr:acyl-CoA dehydrogenase family protein [Chelatococcus sp.]MBS7742644.1 acyl-CoA dehydrogenase family protein [Chelatococcus sp. HY11]CAH1655200.1 Acyl-CoA dehydrogenase [Hyphomicrobiales bacterium]MBX3542238.1 acyl-CoA dehydrogenase family protein [Chelatococcus sp.]MCO5075546.1 acyl-CoA dehydrogenase family protein [Chelatococcus sp.]CAH1695369.1 Acyl-CoA dehydrogenase [Hyphomicrobiales bacterium]